MAMFKYVLQHTRERGYIIDITRRVLDKVIFIIEPGKKPVDYDYVYLDTDAEFKRYRRAGQVPDDTTEQFVSRLKNKSYSWQELENVQFNIPTKIKDITEENLTIAFTLLKRAQ